MTTMKESKPRDDSTSGTKATVNKPPAPRDTGMADKAPYSRKGGMK